ncbi:MAG: isocitrate dehydrogenase (NADP(+)) [Deltaproteobacteria bacterium]
MSSYVHVSVPSDGRTIAVGPDGNLKVPDNPIIPFIEGDGTGPDIWRAAVSVLDAAVAKAYGSGRRLVWMEVYAGEKANEVYGDGTWLPEETNRAIAEFKVAIKGPLTTPVGGGIRSINVTLRHIHDLYACVRPVRHFPGVPAPVREPGKVDLVIFRENTEDVYAGIEFESGSPEAAALAELAAELSGRSIPPGSGIGVKPMSAAGTKRLVRRALDHAIEQGCASVTLVHKGNIMKFTEGAFRQWGYELAADEYAGKVISEDELWDKHDGQAPAGMVVLKDRIADAMFQQLLLRPDEYDVLACPNLNGDYLSDAAAAQVGGLGLAPGANIGDSAAVFEATHGTAPKYAGQDKVNPGSVILSGAMMLEHLGWGEAAGLITAAVGRAISDRQVTYDLHRQMESATLVSCSGFADAVAARL